MLGLLELSIKYFLGVVSWDGHLSDCPHAVLPRSDQCEMKIQHMKHENVSLFYHRKHRVCGWPEDILCLILVFITAVSEESYVDIRLILWEI